MRSASNYFLNWQYLPFAKYSTFLQIFPITQDILMGYYNTVVLKEDAYKEIISINQSITN